MKALVIEDEMMARRNLERLLAENFPDIEVVGECTSVKDSVAWLQDSSNSADIIFMDVELSDGDSFEIFRKVEVKAHVIMATAYDSYALKAFEAGSIDYILKPIDLAPLKRAIDRCRQKTDVVDVSKILGVLTQGQDKHEYKERFLVQFNDRIVPIRTEDISFFFSEDKDNHVVTRDGSVYIVDSSLDAILLELDPALFFKISRSCIIAKNEVDSVTKLLGGRLKVTTKVKVSRSMGPAPDMTVSRSRTEDFLTWLAQ